MAKTLSKRHDIYKIFGIKVVEYTSNYSWKECLVDEEDIREDIILHERIEDNIKKNNKD